MERKELATLTRENLMLDDVKISSGDCVAILIVNENREILIVQENQANEEHGREAGLWNIVTETCEEGEILFHTVCAAIIEEITGRIADFYLFKGSYCCDQLSATNGISYRRHGLVLYYSGSREKEDFSPIDTREIVDYRWVTLGDLEEMTERGAVEPEVLPFVKKMLETQVA